VYHGYGGKVELCYEIAEFFETPHDGPPKVLMITAYLDESDHSDASRYTVVAGFRGKRENWESFAPKWKEALGNRPSLHMKELRWNHPNADTRVRDLLAKLGPIPYDCGLVPVYGAVKASDYIDLVKGHPVLEDFGGYLLSISHVFTLLMETLPVYERIKIVCEEQNAYVTDVKAIFDVFRKTAEPLHAKLAGIEFVPKGSVLIEPADYLAFALGKALSEPESKKDLWCRPIHGEGRPLECRPGMWLNRDVARQTITGILAESGSRINIALSRQKLK
jgi:hypothetical protein